jgi:hypothetical protein
VYDAVYISKQGMKSVGFKDFFVAFGCCIKQTRLFKFIEFETNGIG